MAMMMYLNRLMVEGNLGGIISLGKDQLQSMNTLESLCDSKITELQNYRRNNVETRETLNRQRQELEKLNFELERSMVLHDSTLAEVNRLRGENEGMTAMITDFSMKISDVQDQIRSKGQLQDNVDDVLPRMLVLKFIITELPVPSMVTKLATLYMPPWGYTDFPQPTPPHNCSSGCQSCLNVLNQLKSVYSGVPASGPVYDEWGDICDAAIGHLLERSRGFGCNKRRAT